MRFQTVKGLWALVAALAALAVVASACDLKPPAAGTSSASPSPSESPSPSPEPTPVAITSLSFHAGEVSVAYAPVVMAASGGTPPYQWSVGAGSLPGGLTMSADGTVSGTPTAAGSFTFTVHVADTGGRSFDVGASIPVVPAPQASLLAPCAQYCSVEQGCDSSCGNFGTLTGGTAPYSFTLEGGYVPHGVTLAQLNLVGTFTDVAKFWQFTVLVTDAQGATSSLSPTFYVYPHIYLANGSCYSPYYGTPCSSSLAYAGGTPGGTPTVKVNSASGTLCTPGPTGGFVCNPSSTPPPGFSAAVSGGQVSVNVPASPNSPFTYDGVVTLALTDQSTCTSGTYCSTTASVKVVIQAG